MLLYRVPVGEYDPLIAKSVAEKKEAAHYKFGTVTLYNWRCVIVPQTEFHSQTIEASRADFKLPGGLNK